LRIVAVAAGLGVDHLQQAWIDGFREKADIYVRY
jgi:hypothetical protein